MNDTIGYRLTIALSDAGMLQRELAEILEVKPNVISYFCCDHRIPNTRQIIKISKALGVSSDYLLGLSDAKN